MRELGAEPAADVSGNDVHIGLGKAEHPRHEVACLMGDL